MEFNQQDGFWYHEDNHINRRRNTVSGYHLQMRAELVTISNSQLQESDLAFLHLHVKEEQKLHVIFPQGSPVDIQLEEFPTVCHKFESSLRECSSPTDSYVEMGRLMSQVTDHDWTHEWLTIHVTLCMNYMAKLARELGMNLSMGATLDVSLRFVVAEDEYNQEMARISAQSIELAQADEQGFGAIQASGTSVEELERYVCDGKNLDGGSICVICQDEFSDGVTLLRMPCTHIFHEECLIEWLNRSNSCPVCRFKILSDEIEEK